MQRRGEIPSSLDLLPLGERFGDKHMMKVRMRPNLKFEHVKCRVDHGKKSIVAEKDVEPDFAVSKRKGENFGRMTPQGLQKFLKQAREKVVVERDPMIEIMRDGKFFPKLA